MNSSQQKRVFFIFVAFAIAIGLIASISPFVSATDYPNYNGPLQDRLDLTGGRYEMVVVGRGMENNLTGTVTVTIPAASSVISGFLYWAVIDTVPGGDDTITLTVGDNSPIPLTADDTFGPSIWFRNLGTDYYHYVYHKDITSMIQSGEVTYTLSGLTVAAVQPLIGIPMGFGLVVVYEDNSLPVSTVNIKDGLDSLYWLRTDERRSPSEINCINFPPHNTGDRVMEYNVFVGGIDPIDRPQRLWTLTGSGTPLTSTGFISDVSTAKNIINPFGSFDGDTWDTYQNNLVITATNTYACFQIESIAPSQPPNQDGASILWMMSGTNLKQVTPTAVSLMNVNSNNQPAVWPPILFAIPLLVLSLWFLTRSSHKQ